MDFKKEKDPENGEKMELEEKEIPTEL